LSSDQSFIIGFNEQLFNLSG